MRTSNSWYRSWHTCVIATVEAEVCSSSMNIVYVERLRIVFSKAPLQKRGSMEPMEYPPLGTHSYMKWRSEYSTRFLNTLKFQKLVLCSVRTGLPHHKYLALFITPLQLVQFIWLKPNKYSFQCQKLADDVLYPGNPSYWGDVHLSFPNCLTDYMHRCWLMQREAPLLGKGGNCLPQWTWVN